LSFSSTNILSFKILNYSFIFNIYYRLSLIYANLLCNIFNFISNFWSCWWTIKSMERLRNIKIKYPRFKCYNKYINKNKYCIKYNIITKIKCCISYLMMESVPIKSTYNSCKLFMCFDTLFLFNFWNNLSDKAYEYKIFIIKYIK